MYRPVQQISENKSVMFTCNLDSLDSISEFIKKVYTTVTPKTTAYKARIRRYGTKEQNNVVHMVTMPKLLIDTLFGPSRIDFNNGKNLDITFFFDNNILKKTDKLNSRDEMYILMKVIRNHETDKV